MPRFDFRRRRRRPGVEPRLGLVVPVRALITYKDGEVEYDELAEREAAFRKRGRPLMIFEEDDENSPGWLG